MRGARMGRTGVLGAVVVIALGCGNDAEDGSDGALTTPYAGPYAGYASERYSDDSMWACRPGKSGDVCLKDTSATASLSDGSFESVPALGSSAGVAASDGSAESAADCFYVYPTVDMNLEAGNHDDFADVAAVEIPVRIQAARFGDICDVYAPYYSQVTAGGFRGEDYESLLEVAYADVLDAFKHFVANHSRGRPVIFIGHSQGARLLRMLLQREVDGRADLQDGLALALLIGGDVVVPSGAKVGGSFNSIPLCSSAAEGGCVVAYRSYAKEHGPGVDKLRDLTFAPEGMDSACTNPADPSGGAASFAESYLATFVEVGAFKTPRDLPAEVTTPFALYPRLFSGECVQSTDGMSYLEVSFTPEPGDVRTNPIDFGTGVLSPAILGTHVLDYDFALGDLRELARASLARVGQDAL
jgi:hypothetical protein